MQEYRISVIDERELIPKSKVEAKIEELDKEYKDVRVYNNGFDMQELQAINKKVKELGWYE